MIDDLEGNIHDLLEHDEVEIANLVQEARQSLARNKVEEGEIAKLDKHISGIATETARLKNNGLDDDQSSGIDNFAGSRLLMGLESGTSSGTTLFKRVEMLERYLDILIEAEDALKGDLENKLDKLVLETKKVVNIAKFLEELETDLSEIEKDEEQLEKMVKEAKRKNLLDSNFVERLMGDKSKMEDLAKTLDNLEGEVPKIANSIRMLHSEFQNQMSIDDTKIPSNSDLNKVHTNIKDLYQDADSHYTSNWGDSDQKKELEQVISKFESGGDIRKKINYIKSMESGGSFTSHAVSRLEHTLDQLGVSY
ncbi:MAG: hypothetical protein BRC26_03750 [Nanohaloarchaea archaeon QH_8_44_6]|nr:MAG: hypothetical protein BRC26_03750 [Nanohaloarchaea archaeon QH_8_44_6]